VPPQRSFARFDPLSKVHSVVVDRQARALREGTLMSLIESLRAAAPASGAGNIAAAPTSANAPTSGKKGPRQSSSRASRRQSSPEVPRPSPAARGPPAVASSVVVLAEMGATTAQVPRLSESDFPALPSAKQVGTGTQSEGEEEEVEDQGAPQDSADGKGTDDAYAGGSAEEDGLDDTVVFQSAFVRAHGNASRDSLGLAAAVRAPAPATGQESDYDFLQSLAAGPSASAAPQLWGNYSSAESSGHKSSFFADLGLPPLAPSTSTLLSGSPLPPALAGLGGTGLGGGLWGSGPGGTLASGSLSWDPYGGSALPPPFAFPSGPPEAVQRQLSEPQLDISFLLDCDTPLPAEPPITATPGSTMPPWLSPTPGYAAGPPVTTAPPPPGLTRTPVSSGHSSSASLSAFLQDPASASASASAQQHTWSAPTAPAPRRPPGLG
jgi:hypothetical protein